MKMRLPLCGIFLVSVLLGCGKPACEKLGREELGELLVSLRTKNVVFLGGERADNMACIKAEVEAVLDSRRASSSLLHEIARTTVREGWKGLEPKVELYLTAESGATVAAVVDGLAAEDPERVRGRLGEFLQSRHDEVRASAARISAELKELEHAPIIVEHFIASKGSSRKPYTEALVTMGARDAVRAFITGKSGDEGLDLVPVLARMSHTEGNSADLEMLALLSHPSATIRHQALDQIGLAPRVEDEATGDEYWAQMAARDLYWSSETDERRDKVLLALADAGASSDPETAQRAQARLRAYATADERGARLAALFESELATPKSPRAAILCLGLAHQKASEPLFAKAARSRDPKLRACGRDGLDQLAP